MDSYKKPIVVGNASIGGVVPLAAIVGLSAKALTVVGVAAGLGLGALAKGKGIIDSTQTSALTARKDFSLA